jgi:hypothetical protein
MKPLGWIAGLVIVLITTFFYFKNQIPQSDFLAPGKSWQSSKKVEDYFIEKLRFTESDLERQKQSETVDFRPGQGSTLEAIISNLQYYGFIRSERAFRYALEHTNDTTKGNPGALAVGKNGSIDIVASYRISENMTAWELADTLLNKSHYFGPSDEYQYMFMP